MRTRQRPAAESAAGIQRRAGKKWNPESINFEFTSSRTETTGGGRRDGGFGYNPPNLDFSGARERGIRREYIRKDYPAEPQAAPDLAGVKRPSLVVEPLSLPAMLCRTWRICSGGISPSSRRQPTTRTDIPPSRVRGSLRLIRGN